MDHARTLARFTYRDDVFPLRIFVGQRAPAFVIVCPVCGKNCRISEAHRLVVNVSAGTFTVTPSLICPNFQCGWQVEIRKGVANDVAAPTRSAGVVATSHPERARVCACGRRFRSKSHTECRACREGRPRAAGECARLRLSAT